MKKTVRRHYTEDDQARVAVVLQANEGNMHKTAKELALPFATVATWKKKWELFGYPERMAESIPATRDDFVTSAIEVRWEMLEALREKILRKEVSPRELVQGINVLTDKINILTGLATHRTERVEIAIPNPLELAEALAGFVNRTVDDAINRNEEIEIAEYTTSKPLMALVKGSK